MFTRKITRTVVTTAAFFIIGSVYASQGEAEQFQQLAALDSSTQAIHSEISVPSGRSALTPGLDRNAFEQELSERFLGTHLLYQKLSDEARDAVFVLYQEDNRIDGIRRMVAYSL
ncbi:hypothetical protein Tgr7_1734 [Thioalkalivibrio sulfidiphilus HL-EbGr7]|uniref:Uncharacterized protein n=1 Tax=Thioalkalivibrio sulfidiphilus (strain HL-EbGR7) TaxID=396588 RepID=B8GSB2_THISH|nr:hypothetical protein [Thioalkalivibrio sulfidiphilus]ACL72816.1 hypothetical protein Tgr7_1734 [Thioalkalivibrio sulfidiphilus HL-EbGr7]